MQADTRTIIRRYAFTLIAMGLAVAIALLLPMWTTFAVPLIAAMFVAVVLSVARGGLGQGIVATVLGGGVDVARVYLTQKHFEFDDIFQLVVFIVPSVLACAMIPHWRTVVAGTPPDPNADLLRTAMATAGEAVAVLSDNGGVVCANAAFARIMGHADETLTARSILDAVFPSDRPMAEEALRRSRETGGDELEARILWRDTAPADANLILVRYHTREGSRSGHYCFLRTLSRRRKEVAQQTHDCFHDAFQYSQIGTAIIAIDGRLLEVNLAMCVITGYMEQELKGRDFQSLSHPDDRKADLDLIGRLRAGKLDRYEAKKRLMGPKGDCVVVLLTITMVRSLRGKPLYYIAQMQDVLTVRSQALAAMDAAIESEADNSEPGAPTA